VNEKQLWKKTDKDCMLVDYTCAKGSILISAPKIPVMFWPDGGVCWPVTMWLMEKGKAYIGRVTAKGKRNTNGGSSTTHASLISHLVRFTFSKRNKNFALLLDDDIKGWSEDLKIEVDPKNRFSKRRKSSQTGKIMRSGLNFLLWYQKVMLPHDNLIGEDLSHQITIEEKTQERKSKFGKAFRTTYVDHRHIPTKSTPQKVFAIGHEKITKLYDALRETTSSVQVRKRDENVLRMLEAVGGRRVEVADLKVEDIRLAYKTERMPLQTAKSDDTEPRQVPIGKEWLEPIILYINTYRKKLVKELIKKGKIDGEPEDLFINIRNGKKLSEERITNLISKLRRAANIDEKVCAHMFRHRFITIQVATRLKDFRKGDLPLDVENTILTKVASISGHKDPKSLRIYIDLAFAELNVWDTADKVLKMRSKLEGAFRQIQTLKGDLKSEHLSKKELLCMVETLLGNIISSID